MKSFFFHKSILAACTLFIFLFSASTVLADFNGRTGRTLKSGTTGCSCHGSQTAGVSVVITGPDTVAINMQQTYTVTITGGPLATAGVDIAASTGTLANVSSDLKLSSGELTHTSPKAPSSGSVTFQFKYTAPATIGTQTLYSTGLSTNGNGSTSGDQFNFATNKTVTVVSALPVELTSFSGFAEKNSVRLNWVTATEMNNYGFEIQRKDNNSNWEKISFIKGAGNSNSSLNYSFSDKDVSGKNHLSYRLKQIDYNGTSTLSNIVEINGNFILNNYSVGQNYPNPFNPATNISYNIPADSKVNIKVYNSIGKEVAELVNEVQSAGMHTVTFNASALSSGVYYYTVKSGSAFAETKKMTLIK